LTFIAWPRRPRPGGVWLKWPSGAFEDFVDIDISASIFLPSGNPPVGERAPATLAEASVTTRKLAGPASPGRSSYSGAATSVMSRDLAKRCRARLTRLLIVPTGQLQISAASS
jgi:hypothetical protein